MVIENFIKISDELLLNLCKKFGKEALSWKWKFIGLLPEVNRRKLYESSDRRKKSYGSIVEFAAKMAGISREQVYNVLSLDRVFEDKPVLRKILVNGEVSVNKLIRITAVVTVENQEFWATQVKFLSKSAIETLVRDEKILRAKAAENGGLFAKVEGEVVRSGLANARDEARDGADHCEKNGRQDAIFFEKTETPAQNDSAKDCTRDGLPQPENSNESLPGQRSAQSKEHLFEHLSEQAAKQKQANIREQQTFAHPLKLLKLQLGEQLVGKLLEMQHKGLNINEILTDALQKRDNEIAAEKDRLHEIAVQEAKNLVTGSDETTNVVEAAVLMDAGANHFEGKNTDTRKQIPKKPSHHIKVTIKNLLNKENGTKCVITSCEKLSKPIHHSQRFALAQIHDPYFMAQLCADHHQIAHTIDLKVQEKRSARRHFKDAQLYDGTAGNRRWLRNNTAS